MISKTIILTFTRFGPAERIHIPYILHHLFQIVTLNLKQAEELEITELNKV